MRFDRGLYFDWLLYWFKLIILFAVLLVPLKTQERGVYGWSNTSNNLGMVCTMVLTPE